MNQPDPIDPRYDALPAAQRASMSRKRFAWLSEADKAEFVNEIVEPDPDAEDPAW